MPTAYARVAAARERSVERACRITALPSASPASSAFARSAGQTAADRYYRTIVSFGEKMLKLHHRLPQRDEQRSRVLVGRRHAWPTSLSRSSAACARACPPAPCCRRADIVAAQARRSQLGGSAALARQQRRASLSSLSSCTAGSCRLQPQPLAGSRPASAAADGRRPSAPATAWTAPTASAPSTISRDLAA